MSTPDPASQPDQGEAVATAEPTEKKRIRWPFLLILLLLLVVAGGVGYHFLTAPTLSGEWQGKGKVGASIPFALYLDLNQTDSTHVTGTGEICSPLSDPKTSTFTVTGTTSSDLHNVTLDVTEGTQVGTLKANLTGSTLQVTIPTSTQSISASATLAHGSKADFTATCNALPAFGQ